MKRYFALALLLLCSSFANADSVTLTISNITFNDGGTLNGLITIDTLTGTTFSFVTTDGTTLTGFTYGGYPLHSPSPYRLWFAFGLPEVRVNYPVMGNRIDGHSLLRQAKEKLASTL